MYGTDQEKTSFSIVRRALLLSRDALRTKVCWRHISKVSKRNVPRANRIEKNPEKIKVIVKMQPPQNIKEIQQLTGRIATLNRFLS